ncbi:kelch-like protein 33 [Thalassophryne amazonica]|uniref:kelch-like protein 33 n=1 Tax=Thalassophryne amazonica TaxID=390379 RepID=UPI0014713645|nr:kelch-like protein 33 [Thalassophryne amazonica]
MEFTRQYLPMEWEERWRREKERKKRAIEEGGEAMERDKRELRWIVAYNDSRMGLVSGRGETARTDMGVKYVHPAHGENEEEFQDQENTRIYKSETYPRQVFQVLKEFWDVSLLTDLTLSLDTGSCVHVHSPVMAAVSSFIQERLREKSDERTNDGKGVDNRWSVILGPEVDHVGLQAVLEFAYTGAVSSLTKDTVDQIKSAALVLRVPRVLDLCNDAERLKDRGSADGEDKLVSTLEQKKSNLQSIAQLWEDRVGCDVTLDVDGTLFHVHRVILAASSDYFRGMFTSGMRESHQTCVALPFLLASELEALISCSYSGTLLLSWDCIFEITCTALQLQFQDALSLCLDFMRQEMDASSCLDVASFAEAYGMSELFEEASDFVLRNFWEVSATKKFQDLPAEKLLAFLRCDALCAPSELAVFRAVISWLEADPDQRLGHAGSLMSEVRFPLMTFREFREVRAINLHLECTGNKEVELYGSALKEFGFTLTTSEDRCRIRRPKDPLVVVGGDLLSPDVGQRIPSKELWFSNSLRSGTGLVKYIEWRRLCELPDNPTFRHGVAVMKGKLYVVGGCHFYTKDDVMKSAYSYDPLTDCWKRLADMNEFRSNFSVVAQEDCLYAIGGDKQINTNVDSVEMYNAHTDSWSFVQPLDRALSGYAITVKQGGIFISGGFNCKYECLVSMFLYHPERGTTYLADMTHDRAQHCMEALHGRLYVAGGVCNLRTFYTNQQTCEIYDPVCDSWTMFASLPVPHVGAASAVLEDKIYVLGGYCQEDYSESGLVHRFDPSMQRWENMGKLPGAVTDIRACLLHLPQHIRQ